MNELTLSSPLPLDQNAAAVYVASLSPTGARTQAQALRVIAGLLNCEPASLNWGALRYQHTAAIRSKVAAAYAPNTANKILSALRQTLKHAWLLGQMSVDDYMRAAKLDPILGDTVPAGRYLNSTEIESMFNTCKADKIQIAGIRDAAMIALMYIALLRREEIANLRLDSYNPTTGELLISGKRSHERIAHVSNGAKNALETWLTLRGNNSGALFVAINKIGRITSYNHIGPEAVYRMIARRSAQAGVQNNSPHNFRRTGASDYLNITDPLTVSKIGGWKNVQTLKRYDRRPEEDKKRAMELLHIPL